MRGNPVRRIYLLTMWQERSSRDDSEATWRFSLEDASTRHRRGFANLEALVAFLQEQMAETEATPNDRSSSS